MKTVDSIGFKIGVGTNEVDYNVKVACDVEPGVNDKFPMYVYPSSSERKVGIVPSNEYVIVAVIDKDLIPLFKKEVIGKVREVTDAEFAGRLSFKARGKEEIDYVVGLLEKILN